MTGVLEMIGTLARIGLPLVAVGAVVAGRIFLIYIVAPQRSD